MKSESLLEMPLHASSVIEAKERHKKKLLQVFHMKKKMHNLSFRLKNIQYGKSREEETQITFPWGENRSRQVHTIYFLSQLRAWFRKCEHFLWACLIAASEYFTLRGGSYQYPVWFSSEFILNIYVLFSTFFFLPFSLSRLNSHSARLHGSDFILLKRRSSV